MDKKIFTWLHIRPQWEGHDSRLAMRLRHAHNRAGLPSCAHVRTPSLAGYCLLVLLFVAAAFAFPTSASQAQVGAVPAPAAAATPQHSGEDTPDSWYTKPGHAVVARSASRVAIVFTACRENEKHHVSCQYTDPSGSAHWVYLPGITWPVQAAK